MLIKTIRFKRYTKLSKQQVLQFTQLKTCTLRKKFTVEKNNYVQHQGVKVLSHGVVKILPGIPKYLRMSKNV